MHSVGITHDSGLVCLYIASQRSSVCERNIFTLNESQYEIYIPLQSNRNLTSHRLYISTLGYMLFIDISTYISPFRYITNIYIYIYIYIHVVSWAFLIYIQRFSVKDDILKRFCLKRQNIFCFLNLVTIYFVSLIQWFAKIRRCNNGIIFWTVKTRALSKPKVWSYHVCQEYERNACVNACLTKINMINLYCEANGKIVGPSGI